MAVGVISERIMCSCCEEEEVDVIGDDGCQ